MPQYNVILKDNNATNEQLEQAKQKAKDSGGEIVKEFDTIKGFTVNVPDDKVNVLSQDDSLIVEYDGEMRTQ